MKNLFKNPLFYINVLLLVLLILLSASINPNSTNLPSFAKKALAAVQAILGEGTTNYLAAFTGANQIGNSIIYDTGTNVGIGTTAPVAKLQISPNITNNYPRPLYVQGRSSPVNTAAFVNLGNYGVALGSIDGRTDGTIQAAHFVNGGGRTFVNLVINESGGNVGIGTTNPSQKLDVAGNINVGGSQVKMANSGNHYYGDSSNLAARMSGGFYVQNQTGTAAQNVYANDYWISAAGKWASQVSFVGIYTSNLDGSCRYKNPFTNACSCPSGFTGYQIGEFSNPTCIHGFYADGWRTSNCGIIQYQCVK
ncbi:MAG: hypothetical protein Q8N22_00130 [bacterium]|nr:hypothetical protein [bacterium]